MKISKFYLLAVASLLCLTLFSQENYLVDNYDDPSLWTQVGTNVEVSNNEVNFKNLSLASEQRRVYRELDHPLYATDNWKFSFDFIYSQLGSRNGVPTTGHRLLALTEDNEETGRLCPDVNCTGYPLSETDHITVFYDNLLQGGSNRFGIQGRINTVNFFSSYIYFYNPNQKLYFELEKINNTLFLRIYEDEAKTMLLNDQEVTADICGIEPLLFMQHGVSAGGDYRRGLTGQVDNLVLDKNFTEGCEIVSEWHSNETTLFSNFNKNIGIGTSDAQSKLSIVGNLGVDGDVMAKGIIARPIIWPDYVFEKDYPLRSLEDLEAFIESNSHLPNVPSESEVTTDGINLPDTDAILLEKIEELTLHLIQMNKRVKQLEGIISQQNSTSDN